MPAQNTHTFNRKDVCDCGENLTDADAVEITVDMPGEPNGYIARGAKGINTGPHPDYIWINDYTYDDIADFWCAVDEQMPRHCEAWCPNCRKSLGTYEFVA